MNGFKNLNWPMKMLVILIAGVALFAGGYGLGYALGNWIF